jgi:hypothetical protein
MGFGDTSADTAASLNACKKLVHAQLQAQNMHSLVPIEKIGIPNSSWHFKVVYSALKSAEEKVYL